LAAIANRYAKALVEVSLKLNRHEQVGQELHEFENLLASQKELTLFYSNPAIPIAKKRKVASEILQRLGQSRITSNFVFVLIDNHRMGYFADIRKAFQQELNARLGIAQAEILTAIELDAETQARLEAKLGALTGKKMLLKFSKDSSLIGGVVTRIGDTIYDGSLRHQLDALKTRLSSE
jgi:F-type H+-transporting ATPase subunit delta